MQILILILTLLIPAILIVVFRKNFLGFTKKHPYLFGLSMGVLLGLLACEIHWMNIKIVKEYIVNPITDSIITTFTDPSKNSKSKAVPKQIEIVRFEGDVLKRLSNEKDKEHILTYYSKDNKKAYRLKKDLTEKERTTISDILRSVQYKLPGKIKEVLFTKILNKLDEKDAMADEFGGKGVMTSITGWFSKSDQSFLQSHYVKKDKDYVLQKPIDKIDKEDQSRLISILKKGGNIKKNNSLILYAIISQRSLTYADRFLDMGYPWPRRKYGEITEFFSLNGAKVFSFDFIYSEKSIYRQVKPPDDDSFRDAMGQARKDYSSDAIISFTFGDLEEKAFNNFIVKKVFKRGFRKFKKKLSDLSLKELLKVAELLGLFIPEQIKIVRFEKEILKGITNEKNKHTILTYYSKDNNKKVYLLKKGLKAKERAAIFDILISIKYIKPQTSKPMLIRKMFKAYYEKRLKRNSLKLEPYEIQLVPDHPTVHLPHFFSVTPPYKTYLEDKKKVHYIASVNALKDGDGLFRRTPLLIEYHHKYYPSLAFASYLAYIDFDPAKEKIILRGSHLIVRDGEDDKERKIPLDREGKLRIKYYGWGNKAGSSYDDINLIDIITFVNKTEKLYNLYRQVLVKQKAKVPEEKAFKKSVYQNYEKYQEIIKTVEGTLGKGKVKDVKLSGREAKVVQADFKGKIVMMATIAPGLLDIRRTPFLETEAGAHIHVSALDNMIQGDFLTEASDNNMYLMILLISLATGLFTAGSSLLRSITAWILLSIGVYVLGIVLFKDYKFVMDIAIPLIAVFIVFLADTIVHYIAEQKEKGYIKGAFGQYLSPKVIEIIMNDPSKLSLGGESKIITAFFSDVAGFSTISEKLTPGQLVQLLNDYLTAMCDIAEKYDGTVDKFEGDAIIAFWGAPLDEPEHARMACYTAIEMQQYMEVLRKKWTEEGQNELITNMKMRVGLNSGKAVIGNMGSAKRMDYTMMGDTVNLAARLEGANKFYGTYNMISDATYQMAKDSIDVRELDKIQVVGKKVAVVVYELLDKKGQVTGAKADGVDQYLKAMELYKQQKFDEAIKAFEAVFKAIPKDPPAKTYIDRCHILKENPPGPDWDGRYVLTSKG